MDTWSNEEMAEHFLTLYRARLPQLLRAVQHPAKELDPAWNLKENFCGRELRVAEEESQSQSQSQSSFLHLLRTKKKVRQVEKALAETDEAFREKMKVIGDRWGDLHTRRAQLRDYMERSGKIIQENEEVRILALRIDSKEKEVNVQKESELLRVKMELEALRKEHWKLCKKLQKYSIFKKYLDDVVKISQFEDIPEVTSRYELLLRIYKDLLQSQQGQKELTEQDKVLLEQYRAEKEAEILQYKSELVQLKLRFDQAQSDVLLWETRWADIQNRTSKKTRKLWTIKMAIHNLFLSTNKWLNVERNVSVDDSLSQLDRIQQFIQHLKDIRLYRGQEEASVSSYTYETKRDLTCPYSEDSVGWEGKEDNPTDSVN